MNVLGLIRNTLCSLTFIVTAPLLAEPQIGSQWIKPTEQLIKQGITKIGDFDLRNFQQEARKIRWEYYSADNPPSFAQGRKSAYYLPSSKEVFISNQIPRQMGNSMVLLELHEALGALGYRDQDYSLSVGIHLLSQMPKGKEQDFILKEFGSGIFQKSQMESGTGAGSGSSVGGGGDIIPLTVKFQVLQKVVKGGSGVTKEFLAGYPKIAFEPLYEKNEQFVGLLYEANPALKRSINHEKISVYVPILNWKKGNDSKNKIIVEIIDHVTSLFPAYPGTPMTKVSPVNCNTKKTVSFPRAKTTAIATMQSVRAGIILNCEGSLQITELRSPSFKTHQELATQQKKRQAPSSPNQKDHNCVLKINNYTLPFEANLKKMDGAAKVHVTAHSSRKGQTKADTLVYAYIVPNNQGHIREIIFAEYSMVSDKILVNVSKKFSQNQRKELKTRTYSKDNLTITCQSAQR